MHFKGTEIKKFLRDFGLPIFFGAVGSAVLSAAAVYYGMKTNDFLLTFLFCAVAAAGFGMISAKNNRCMSICIASGTMAAGAAFGAITAAILPSAVSDTEIPSGFVKPMYKLSENLTGLDTYFVNKKIFADNAKIASEMPKDETVSASSLVMPLIFVAVAVFLVALAFSYLNRMRYVKRKECDFPEAMAASAVILKTENTKNNRKNIIGYRIGLIIGGIVGAVRSAVPKIPFSLELKPLNEKFGTDVGIALSPMIGAFGYIAGFRRALAMALGGLIVHTASVPLFTALKICPDISSAAALRNQIGVGFIIGSGIGVICDFILIKMEANERRKLNGEPDLRDPLSQRTALIAVSLSVYLGAFLLLLAAGVNLLFALITVAISYIICHSVNAVRGESGIFSGVAAVAVSAASVLTVKSLFGADLRQTVLCILFSAAVCALSSEFMSTYKVGTSVGTKHGVLLAVNIIGAVVGIATALICFFSLVKNPDILSAKSTSSALVELIGSDMSPAAVWISAAITAALTLLKLPAASFALGAFLPFSCSVSFFIGGFIRFIHTKKRKRSNFNAAYGLSCGEGVAIVLVAVVMWVFGI